MMNVNPASVQTVPLSSHETRLYVLPELPKIAQIEFRQLLKSYCKADLDIKLAFSTFKVRNVFSSNDSVPYSFRSRVVYQFTCAGCNACYIGDTTRHI